MSGMYDFGSAAVKIQSWFRMLRIVNITSTARRRFISICRDIENDIRSECSGYSFFDNLDCIKSKPIFHTIPRTPNLPKESSTLAYISGDDDTVISNSDSSEGLGSIPPPQSSIEAPIDKEDHFEESNPRLEQKFDLVEASAEEQPISGADKHSKPAAVPDLGSPWQGVSNLEGNDDLSHSSSAAKISPKNLVNIDCSILEGDVASLIYSVDEASTLKVSTGNKPTEQEDKCNIEENSALSTVSELGSPALHNEGEDQMKLSKSASDISELLGVGVEEMRHEDKVGVEEVRNEEVPSYAAGLEGRQQTLESLQEECECLEALIIERIETLRAKQDKESAKNMLTI